MDDLTPTKHLFSRYLLIKLAGIHCPAELVNQFHSSRLAVWTDSILDYFDNICSIDVN